MILLAILALFIARYIFNHPEICGTPMPKGAYHGARFRILGLVAISLVAIGIATILPAGGNVAFMLMMVIGPMSRRIEARHTASTESNTLSV
ncbi:MAG: hypothetical protein JNN20_19175 [Betaproteobacteria bacterium]|nr:hypothetical protein [Betaproteobacteria bacterium]